MSDGIAAALSPFQTKRLARAARTHTKNAMKWKRGVSKPSAERLVEMMRSDADIFAAIVRLAGRADVAARAVAAEHLRAALRAIGGEEE